MVVQAVSWIRELYVDFVLFTALSSRLCSGDVRPALGDPVSPLSSAFFDVLLSAPFVSRRIATWQFGHTLLCLFIQATL